MSRVLRLGTRGSALATTQSGHVADRLAAAGVGCELVLIKTEGDVNSAPLATIGGTGVFVTAVRTALLDGRVDVIVHSYKDLPTATADGVRLVAVPPRANPFDALCARDGMRLADLPAGATVGTGSPRRVAQLRRLRPDITVTPIRGNVDTRLGFVASGALDAVVLARAGLERLDRHDRITELFDGGDFLPAPAQGALAVECRDDDAWFIDALASVGRPRHPRGGAGRTRAAGDPRGRLQRSGGRPGDRPRRRGDPRRRGHRRRRAPRDPCAGHRSGRPTPLAVGAALAADLIGRGAAELLGAARL